MFCSNCQKEMKKSSKRNLELRLKQHRYRKPAASQPSWEMEMALKEALTEYVGITQINSSKYQEKKLKKTNEYENLKWESY